MAAIIHPDLSPALDAQEWADEPFERPQLVVIEGGSLAALRRRQPAAVYRSRRRVAAALVVLALALASLGVRALLPAGAEPTPAPAAAAPATAAASVVVAAPGDSLWTIARRVQPDGDVRPLVDAMRDANGGATLQAGQRVLVPAR
jgi:hypothetical protein